MLVGRGKGDCGGVTDVVLRNPLPFDGGQVTHSHQEIFHHGIIWKKQRQKQTFFYEGGMAPLHPITSV